MSKYEDYNQTCHNYDSVRIAVGYDVIAGMVPYYCGKQLKDLHILDAGCGTGNYAVSLLNAGLGHVTLLDASSGMLDKARAKLRNEISSGRVVDVKEIKMPPIPYPDENFDAVMFNLVLHHLQEDPDGIHFPAIESVLKEARRVLKKDGVLTICTNWPEKYLPLVWFTKLNEDIMHRHGKSFPNFNQWQEMFEKCGFTFLKKLDHNMPAPTNMVKGFLDPLGPTKKEWRDGNSYWASATPEEISEIERKVLEMHENGTLDDFYKQHNKIDGIFYLSFMFAIRKDLE